MFRGKVGAPGQLGRPLHLGYQRSGLVLPGRAYPEAKWSVRSLLHGAAGPREGGTLRGVVTMGWQRQDCDLDQG